MQMTENSPTTTSFECGGGQFYVFRYAVPLPRFEAGLTDAEQAVAALLIEGLRTDTIAQRRETSVRTTNNQIASIYRKVGVCSRVEFIVACFRNGEV